MKSFFVSYNQADRAWADWIVAQLEPAGYTTVYQARDFRAGSDFIEEMRKAVEEAERTIAVMSPEALEAPYSRQELNAALAKDPTGSKRLLIPVRVRDCQPRELLQARVYVDLVGTDEPTARQLLLKEVQSRGDNGGEMIVFPGATRSGVCAQAHFPGDQVAGSPSRPTRSQLAENGSPRNWLQAWTELIERPEARDLVLKFRSSFRFIDEQINTLFNYKALHDQLHTLQIDCYDMIVAEASFFLKEERTRALLPRYGRTLDDIVERLRQISAQPSFSARNVDWIDDLAEAARGLRRAVANADSTLLQEAIDIMRHVLNVQPGRIDASMTQAAAGLPLRDLVDSLTGVYERIAGLDLDPQKVAQFKVDVDNLRRLNDDLDTLRDDHNQWQEVDCNLRLIEDHLDAGPDPLRQSWPRLRKRTERLCSARTDDLAVEFRTAGEKLDRAILNRTDDSVELFRDFRSQAGRLFFRVDFSMKSLCEDLRQQGHPLAKALELIS